MLQTHIPPILPLRFPHTRSVQKSNLTYLPPSTPRGEKKREVKKIRESKWEKKKEDTTPTTQPLPPTPFLLIHHPAACQHYPVSATATHFFYSSFSLHDCLCVLLLDHRFGGRGLTQLFSYLPTYLLYLFLSDYDYFNLHSPSDLFDLSSDSLRRASDRFLLISPSSRRFLYFLPQTGINITLCIPPYNCRLVVPGLKWFTLRARNALYI